MEGKTIDTHEYKYFKAGKANEALRKRMLRNDEFLALIASFVHTKTVDAIADQPEVGIP